MVSGIWYRAKKLIDPSREGLYQQLDPVFNIKYQPDQQKIKFDHWDYIGTSHKCKRSFKTKVLKLDETMKGYSLEFPKIFQWASQYTTVVEDMPRYEKALKKGDAAIKKPAGNPAWNLAKEFVEMQLSYLHKSKINTGGVYNRSASPGEEFEIKKYQTKGEVLDDENAAELLSSKYKSLSTACEKHEMLSKHDVFEREKLRTYMKTCLRQIVKQKIFFNDQNNRIKANNLNGWIQYGYVKQRGGFSNLISRLEKFNFKYCADISGWDRKFPLMKEIYELREKFLEEMNQEMYVLLRATIAELVEQLVILRTGDIYRKRIGNPSGSNNTTEDNCIGHLFIKMYLLIKIFKYYKGRLPEYREIKELALVFLFGDDNLGGVDTKIFEVTPKEFDPVFKSFYKEVYEEFGMEVKFLRTEHGYGPLKTIQEGGEMEFLGSKPLGTIYGVIPKPNISHLCMSLLKKGEDENGEEVLISKIKASIDLVYCGKEVDEECAEVFRFVHKVCLNMLCNKNFSLDTTEIFLKEVVLGIYTPIELVTGRQSASSPSPEDVFFLRPQQEVGRNIKTKFISMKKTKQNTMLKDKNKQIHDLQMKLHETKLRAKIDNSSQHVEKAVKDIAMAVINPDSVAGYRYPDSFSEPTSTFKGIGNFFVPVTLDTDIDLWPAGSWYVEVHPEVDHPIRYISEIDATDETVDTALVNWFPTDESLYGLYNGQMKVSDITEYLLNEQITLDVVLPFYVNGVLQAPTYLTTSDGVSSDGWYYYPCVGTLNVIGESQIRVNGRAIQGGTVDLDITVFQTMSDGSAGGTDTATRGSTGSWDCLVDLASSTKSRYGWKLQMTIDNTGTGTLGGVCSVTGATGRYIPDYLYLASHPLPNLVQIRDTFEKYRVTAMSSLITYFGSTLTNAGFVSSILYRGGHPPSFANLNDYSSIAEHPNSYDGPLKEGTYVYWEPMDEIDMSFRCPMIRQSTTHRPLLIETGLYNGDPSEGVISSANLLRCRVILQVEFTSQSQIYDSVPSPVCPDALAAAAIVTQGVPNAMENGKHLNKLRNIASKAGKVAKSIGSFAWNNRQAIEQLAMAAIPVLM